MVFLTTFDLVELNYAGFCFSLLQWLLASIIHALFANSKFKEKRGYSTKFSDKIKGVTVGFVKTEMQDPRKPMVRVNH